METLNIGARGMKRILLLCILVCAARISGSAQVNWVLNVIMEVGDDAKRLQRGRAIIGMDDINNDGWPDLAVGLHTLYQTYIYFGGPGILDTAADVRIQGDGPMVKGDFDGDGKMDYVISSYGTSNDTLLVYLGKTPSPLKIDTIPNLRINPENLNDDFGECQGRRGIAVGDLNKDGFADLVVGARSFGAGQGKTYIYIGKRVPDGRADLVAVGDSVSEYFGYGIAIADINGDGYDDLAISADSRRTPPTIDIWYGGPSFTFERNNYAQRFTFAPIPVSFSIDMTLVDFNADGKADLSYSDGHRTYFHFGATGGLPTTPSFVVKPESTYYSYSPRGGAIGVGDLNGDGKEDFVIRQAPRGYAFMCVNVYLGDQSPSRAHVSGGCRSSVNESSAFREVVPVGDINGDGINDFAGAVPYDNQVEYVQDGYFVVFSGNRNWVTDVGHPTTPSLYEFELSQNYPNPFNPSTTVRVEVVQKGHVLLGVYDVLGKEVARIADGIMEPGSHEIQWDGMDVGGRTAATGVYLCRLIFNGTVMKTRKLWLFDKHHAYDRFMQKRTTVSLIRRLFVLLFAMGAAVEARGQNTFLIGAEWLNNPSRHNIPIYDPSNSTGIVWKRATDSLHLNWGMVQITDSDPKIQQSQEHKPCCLQHTRTPST